LDKGAGNYPVISKATGTGHSSRADPYSHLLKVKELSHIISLSIGLQITDQTRDETIPSPLATTKSFECAYPLQGELVS